MKTKLGLAWDGTSLKYESVVWLGASIAFCNNYLMQKLRQHISKQLKLCWRRNSGFRETELLLNNTASVAFIRPVWANKLFVKRSFFSGFTSIDVERPVAVRDCNFVFDIWAQPSSQIQQMTFEQHRSKIGDQVCDARVMLSYSWCHWAVFNWMITVM